MGFYSALMKQVADLAQRLERRENIWREQEAKVLKVLDLCRIARHDDSGVLSRSLTKVCNLLEIKPDLQSPMIMDALRLVAKESNVAPLRDAAAQSYKRMDWRVAQADRKAGSHRMTHDNWITDDQKKIDASAFSAIEALRPLLASPDEVVRKDAVESLVTFAAEPSLDNRLRRIFTGSALPDSETVLQRIDTMQAQEAARLADELASSPVAPRPCRI